MKFKIYIIIILISIIHLSCNEIEDKMDTSVDNKSNPVNTIKNDDKLQLQYQSETPEVTHYALLKTTMGKIRIQLFGKDAPKTVENFISLAKSGYYNGVLIHRVAKNFLIQTGDGNTKYKSKKAEWGFGGKSSFGKEFNDEINPKSTTFKMGYRKGTVAMANRGLNTNTSQFFICLDEAINLEPRWTIFGRVVEGIDVVERISNVDVIASTIDPDDGIPVKPIKILSVSIKTAK